MPRSVQAVLAARINSLGKDPYPHGAEKLTGFEDCWKVREGAYRVVYQVRDKELIVLIIKVGDRKDVYRNLTDSLPKIIAAWEASWKRPS